MNSSFRHIKPRIEDWTISKFAENRDTFKVELEQIVADKISDEYQDIGALISKTVYMEEHRIKTNPWKVDPADESDYWKEIAQQLKSSQSSSEKTEIENEILKKIIKRYVAEITGDFKVGTFKFARKFLTWFFKVIFNKFSEGNLFQLWGTRKILCSKIILSGKVEEVRSMFDKGTMVIVPTHFSNLDSIMVGYMIDAKAGLPAFTYGAGLNLFDYEIPAYFMNRLGAYKVDRRKKNPIYLMVLKEYVSSTLQYGLNNLFFPGGTRSRSGELESKLKLGLLGSLIEAQRESVIRKENNKIIVVPLVIGYNFVFEAESLVEQHLKLDGKELYRKTKAVKKSKGNWFWLVKSLFKKNSEVYMSFGQPMDVFGNFLSPEAKSLDVKNQEINFEDYFEGVKGFNVDNQREQVYTQLLGEKIVEEFKKTNVVLPSHLVSFVAFKYLENLTNENVFSLVCQDSDILDIDFNTFLEFVSQAKSTVEKWALQGKLSICKDYDLDIKSFAIKGIQLLGIYHESRVLYIDVNALRTENLKLLYFYHNRLIGYNLENFIDWSAINNTLN
ncbi:MAG TPA: 1-acyl-sn-glycerol-3-phosphate acyltransferase [Saprospiraceae bacterium]|nr:1-acyl-sn-glycerol-3-phosphate acyltransferase [Saprospiraceae bacterium]